MSDEFEKATARPWFVHDFTGAVPPRFSVSPWHVTVSCDHPASITVALMGHALTATVEEAQANARLIIAAVNERDGMLEAWSSLQRIAAAPGVDLITSTFAKNEVARIRKLLEAK